MGNRILTIGGMLMLVAGFGKLIAPDAAWTTVCGIAAGAIIVGWQIGAIADAVAHRGG